MRYPHGFITSIFIASIHEFFLNIYPFCQIMTRECGSQGEGYTEVECFYALHPLPVSIPSPLLF